MSLQRFHSALLQQDSPKYLLTMVTNNIIQKKQ